MNINYQAIDSQYIQPHDPRAFALGWAIISAIDPTIGPPADSAWPSSPASMG
jgi:hypothetical protein